MSFTLFGAIDFVDHKKLFGVDRQFIWVFVYDLNSRCDIVSTHTHTHSFTSLAFGITNRANTFDMIYSLIIWWQLTVLTLFYFLNEGKNQMPRIWTRKSRRKKRRNANQNLSFSNVNSNLYVNPAYKFQGKGHFL